MSTLSDILDEMRSLQAHDRETRHSEADEILLRTLEIAGEVMMMWSNRTLIKEIIAAYRRVA